MTDSSAHDLPKDLDELDDFERETVELWLGAQAEYKKAVNELSAARMALGLPKAGNDARAFLTERRAVAAGVEDREATVKQVRKALLKRFRNDTRGLFGR
jgi:hypothetical protein